jgi:hypothetical protein
MPAQQQQQQQQQEKAKQTPKVKGLHYDEYFAIARAQRSSKQSSSKPAAADVEAAPTAAAAAGAGATGTAAADSFTAEQWVALSLPVNPDEAAAFRFTAARDAGAATGPPAGVEQTATTAAAAAGAPAGSSSSRFGAAEARQQLLAWGADPEQATAAWVANHYKWIVWKLAAYDRKFVFNFRSSSGSNSGSGPAAAAAADYEGPVAAAAGEAAATAEAEAAPWFVKEQRKPAAAAVQAVDTCCLSVRNVMQQLQGRYTAEVSRLAFGCVLWHHLARLAGILAAAATAAVRNLPLVQSQVCAWLMQLLL